MAKKDFSSLSPKKSFGTSSNVERYKSLAPKQETLEQRMDNLWTESTAPNVLPTAKPSINTTVKPINISQFVKSVEESNVGKQAKLNYQNDKLREQIEQKEKEYARANNISDWSKKNQEKSRIQQELNALNSQFDANNKQIVSLSKPTLMTAEQVEKANKNAPLSQKIDKALKWDIPRTAEKVGRTALDLAMQIPVGATNALEGMVDTGVGNVGALASTVADKVGADNLASRIRNGAENFVKFNFSGEEILEEKKNEGTGIYEPKILGVKVRDALNTISNMVTAGVTGGTLGFIGSAAGQNIEEALLDNQSLNRAVIYGDVSGVIEGLTEKMFDTVKLLGGGKLDKFLPKSAIGKLIGGGSIGEGIEEVISGGINPLLKKLTYEQGTYELPEFWDYVKMLGESFWNGAVIGLIMKGGQDISTPQFREQYKQDVYTAVDKSKLPDNIKEQVKEAMLTPAQAQINQDLGMIRNSADYQRTQQTNMLPTYSQIQQANLAQNQANEQQNIETEQTIQPQTEIAQKGEIQMPTAKTNAVYNTAKQLNVDTQLANRVMEMAKLTEVPINGFVDVNPKIDGYYKDGAIYINKNSEKAQDRIFVHELTHNIEKADGWQGLRDTIFNSNVLYNELAEKGQTLEEYRQLIKDTYAENGIELNEDDVDREVIAKFAEEHLLKDQKSIERMVQENPTFMQRVKNFIDDLVVKFKGTAEEKELLKIQRMYDKAFAESKQTQNNVDKQTEFSISESQEETLKRLNEDWELYNKVREDSYNKRDNVKKQYFEMINSQEYKQALNHIKTLKDTNEIQNSKEYQLIVEADRLNKKAREYQEEIDTAYAEMERISLALAEEEKSHREPSKAIKQAKKSFGTTTNFKEAGYLLQDGSLLDLSGKNQGGTPGRRSIDHREINEVGYDMSEFIDLGNIRLQPESNGFELMHEPTEKQYETLKKYIENANGEVFIDIYKNNKMAQYDSKEYPKNTSATKIISDIQHYFKNGSFPYESDIQKFRYSINTDNQGRQLSKQQQEFFKDSKVRDESGKLLEVYHGTPSGGFTIFDANKLSRDTKTTQYGKGFYFTDKQNLAKAYSEGENSQLYSVYLDIKNPFTISWLDDKSHNLDRDGLKNILLEGNNKEFYDKWIADSQSNIEKLGNLTKDNILKMSKEEKVELFLKGEYDRFNDQHVLRELVRAFNTNSELIDSMQRNLGYDGIIVEDKLRGNQYIAFNSNQIKNIDNTNPTENEDIRYSVETRGQATAPKKPTVVDNIAPKIEQNIEDLPQETQKVAKVLTKAPKKDLDLSFETVSDMLMRKIVDAGNTINTIGKLSNDETLYPMYNNTKQARQSAEYMIGEKQTDITGTKIVGNSLVEIFKPVKAKGEEYTGKFYEYLLHMHNIDRMAQGKPVFGSSVTAEISRQKADELLKENPEFEKLANKVYVYNRNLMQWRVDSGLISQEQADIMNKMYPHYVPTFRDMSGTAGSKIVGNAVNIANTVRKATGGNRDILPLDLAMARQTMQTVQAAKRNLFGNRLLNDVLANQEKAVKYITAIEKSEDGLDVDEQSDASLSQPNNNTNVFKIYRDGKSFNMYVNSGIFEGLRAISSQVDATDTNKLLNALSKPNTMFKQLVTGMNPMFLINNPVRDIQDATLYSKNLRKFLNNYPKTFKEQLENSADWQLYKALGGVGSSFFDYETGIDKALNKSKLQRLSDNTLGRIEGLNMMTEQAPRFAEFKATIERAGNRDYDTLMKAIYNAADVTVNFGRTGTITQVLNKTIVPFLNPSIQGADKLIRTLATTKGGSEWAKLVTKATLFGILPSVLNELIFGDDEEYENLNDRDKDRNFVFKYGDNKWIKIPKGRVISSLGNLANRGIRLVKGQEVNWGDYLSTLADQTAPISPLESNIFSPIKAIKDNKTWYGSDIVPQRLQQYEARDQYDEKTDAFSKWLGGILNYSPKKINYLIDAYTGVIGDFALPLTTPTAEVNPFMKAFTIDGNFSNEIGNKFYETKDKYSKYKNNKPSAVVVSRYLNKQNDMVNDLHAEIRKIQSSDVSDAEKKAKSGELRELINLIESTAIMNVKEYEKAVEKYISKFPNNKERSEDYAYLMANKEMFGAEYAVKAYSTKKYNDNRKKNMNTVFNEIIKNYSKVKTPVAEQEKETLPTALDIPRKIK